MNHLPRLLELLPPPLSVNADSLIAQILKLYSLEMEVFEEDLDAMRRTHWVNFAYRLGDLEKIADLVGIDRLPWEQLPMFRTRLLALVVALLRGAVGPAEIRGFVYDYLRRAEEALDAVFVPHLSDFDADDAFRDDPDRPRLRHLALVENPRRLKQSLTLESRAGRVPYLYRWDEQNRGLDETLARFEITGYPGGRTAVPILVNRTTGDLLGFSGRVPFGRTLIIESADDGDNPRAARARLDETDVTQRLFSVSGFQMGVPFDTDDLDDTPLLPRMARGANEWVFLSVGLYNVRGLNHVFFAIAGEDLREGVFNTTFFDKAVFPSGTLARIRMTWIETEPASFEVRIPRYIVSEPALASAEGPAWQRVEEAMVLSIADLHAAGVRGDAVFEPFVESQRQRITVQLPWIVLDPERGPAGERDTLNIGGRFGESGLDDSRFE